MIGRAAFIITVLAVVGLALGRSGAAMPPVAGEFHADRIVIEKAARRLTLYAGDRVLKTYAVALGHGGLTPKARQGDGSTPEGRYRIDSRNPHSAFHLSLHVSYPEVRDIKAAAAHGVSPGGQIMIHGLPNGLGMLGGLHRNLDWTAGCIAV